MGLPPVTTDPRFSASASDGASCHGRGHWHFMDDNSLLLFWSSSCSSKMTAVAMTAGSSSKWDCCLRIHHGVSSSCNEGLFFLQRGNEQDKFSAQLKCHAHKTTRLDRKERRDWLRLRSHESTRFAQVSDGVVISTGEIFCLLLHAGWDSVVQANSVVDKTRGLPGICWEVVLRWRPIRGRGG